MEEPMEVDDFGESSSEQIDKIEAANNEFLSFWIDHHESYMKLLDSSDSIDNQLVKLHKIDQLIRMKTSLFLIHRQRQIRKIINVT